MATHDWNGRTITVRVRLMPRYAWMVAWFFVDVDGQTRTAWKGIRKWPGAPLHFTIEDPGGPISAVLRPARFISMYSGITYSLHIGPEVFHGRAYAENAYMHTIPIGIMVSFGLASFTAMCTLWLAKAVLYRHNPFMLITLKSGDPKYVLWSSLREFGLGRVTGTSGPAPVAETLFSTYYSLAIPAAALIPLFWLALKYRGYRARKKQMPARGFPL